MFLSFYLYPHLVLWLSLFLARFLSSCTTCFPFFYLPFDSQCLKSTYKVRSEPGPYSYSHRYIYMFPMFFHCSISHSLYSHLLFSFSPYSTAFVFIFADRVHPYTIVLVTNRSCMNIPSLTTWFEHPAHSINLTSAVWFEHLPIVFN